jgi:RAQPRD family integrative conjugative element protein
VKLKMPSLKQAVVIGTLIGVLAWIGCASAALAAQTRAPIQREDLALINSQLARVDQVIDRLTARQANEPPGHVRLDVARLRADVDTIRAGITTYLSPPRLAPRHLAPLAGHYATHGAPASQ